MGDRDFGPVISDKKSLVDWVSHVVTQLEVAFLDLPISLKVQAKVLMVTYRAL